MRAMVLVAMLAMWAAGCQDDEHFPPGEGGGAGGGGGSERIDAGADGDAGSTDAGDDLDGGAQLSGRLCDPLDVRDPLEDCADTGLAGIDVVDLASNDSDDTDAEGRFTLTVDREDDQVLAVGRADATTRDALVPVDQWNGDDVVAPRMSQASWDQLMIDIGGLEPDMTASVALYVLDENGPIAGAEVSSDPVANQTFYDDALSPSLWSQGILTGPFGAALLLDIPVDTVSQLTVAVGSDSFPLTVPVAPDHVTWARLVLP